MMGGAFTYILPLLLLAGMMFFMTRSQKKQQNERQTLLDSMKIGDEIVTIGGLHGVVSEINEDKKTVLIDCEGIILEFDRTAIRTVNTVAEAVPAANDSEEQTIEEAEKEEKE